jgi:hypothetical protein
MGCRRRAADVGLAGRSAVEQTRRRSGPLKRRPVGQTKGRCLAVLLVACVAERLGGAAAGSLRDAGPLGARLAQRASGIGRPAGCWTSRLADRLGTRSAWSPDDGERTKGRGRRRRRLRAATAGPFDDRPWSKTAGPWPFRGSSLHRARSVGQEEGMPARGHPVLTGRRRACRPAWPAIRAAWPAAAHRRPTPTLENKASDSRRRVSALPTATVDLLSRAKGASLSAAHLPFDRSG